MFVAEDGSEAAVFYFRVLAESNAPLNRLKLKGLDPAADYALVGTSEVYTGDALMYAGIAVGAERGDYHSEFFRFRREMVIEQNGEVLKAQEKERIVQQIAKELQLSLKQIRTTVGLLDEGNTIPFIARYRKEMTGELDENQLRGIEERVTYLRNLEERKREVIRIIDEQGKLTGELKTAIEKAAKLQEVEDLYRPYRQKRKTRASVAKEKGLEPLSEWIMAQPKQGDVHKEAAKYVDAEKGVETADDAISGAMDILAENLADDATIRAWVRRYTMDHGMLTSEAKDPEQESVYENYYNYRELAKKMPPHRILAINRGERENILKVGLEVQPESIHNFMARQVIKGSSAVQPILTA
ncbi:hypothetical protein BGX30_007381, partial [Mortierella sp. GBA39]